MEAKKEKSLDIIPWHAREYAYFPEQLQETEQCAFGKISHEHKQKLLNTHQKLYHQAKSSMASGFASLQRALVDMQVHVHLKLETLEQTQASILEKHDVSISILEAFENNVKTIQKNLEFFVLQANDLSSVKLTVMRAAGLVATQNPLAQLVTLPWQKGDQEEHTMFTKSKIVAPPSTYSTLQQPILKMEELYSYDATRTRCFVFYLPAGATNESLRSMFMKCGNVLNAYIVFDKITNQTRGFGFVDFATVQEANCAVRELDKFPWDGKFLSVSICKKKE